MTVEVLQRYEIEPLKAQVARHIPHRSTRRCAACGALHPCAYRQSARNKLRAAGVHVEGLL